MITALLFSLACSTPEAPKPPPVAKVEAPAPVVPAPAPAPAAYPICDRGPTPEGQNLGRTGDPGRQLAPVGTDRMVDCADADEVPAQAMADAAAGKLSDKGNCEWANGVSCHFHGSIEFTDAGAPAAEGTRELHCIFPGDADKNSPEVFGGHFTCKAGTAPTEKGAAGAACGAGLLPALRASMEGCNEDVHCCDDGTLTKGYADQSPEERQLRPDFHICTKAMEIDCGLIGGMEAHHAFGHEAAAGH